MRALITNIETATSQYTVTRNSIHNSWDIALTHLTAPVQLWMEINSETLRNLPCTVHDVHYVCWINECETKFIKNFLLGRGRTLLVIYGFSEQKILIRPWCSRTIGFTPLTENWMQCNDDTSGSSWSQSWTLWNKFWRSQRWALPIQTNKHHPQHHLNPDWSHISSK